MLISLWSPKGGSGTSVLAAAFASVLARSSRARLADLTGDQPAVLALGAEPDTGLDDWLAAGPAAPADALDRVAVDVLPQLALLPRGSAHGGASPEAGAALGVVLRDDDRPTVADLGQCSAPASGALRDVSDASIVVMRGCYLALKRAVGDPAVSRATGIVVVDEPGRALGADDVGDVLGRPVLATVPVRAAIARAVDAGVLVSRVPDPLERACCRLARRLGITGRAGRAA